MNTPIPFGNYLLLERINVGGMAEVFKAKAFGVEGFERLVAVKKILPNIAEDTDFITMFIDEAKISVQLTHANIAQVFDLGKVDDSYFIALEYVRGRDLRLMFDRARKKQERLPIALSAYVLMKVCEGLDYAHNKRDASGQTLNLIHRDVSPQNVLISYEGDVKIIDFGVAKAAGKTGKTQSGILKGKFGYMSPEQVRGLPIDKRSDVFAAGIVLHEILTGERLFVAESDFSTLAKIRAAEVEPPSKKNTRVPEELDRIVMKALARDVEDRYASAMDLHDDLQSFMYSSGNFFSRKELAQYMADRFAEDMARESIRDEEFRRIEAPASRAVGVSYSAAGSRAPVLKAVVDDHGAQTSYTQAAAKGAGRKSRGNTMSIKNSQTPPAPPNDEAEQVSVRVMWEADEDLATELYDKQQESSVAPSAVPPLSAVLPPPPLAPSIIPPTTQAGQSHHPVVHPATKPSGLARPTPSRATHASASPLKPGSVVPPAVYPSPTVSTRHSTLSWARAKPAWLALIALGGLALVSYFVFASKPGSIHLTTQPTDAQVLLDGKSVGIANSPYVLVDIDSTKEHVLSVSRSGYETWSMPVRIRSGETLVLPVIELRPSAGSLSDRSAKGVALVSFNSNPPGATVYIVSGSNRTRVGTAPTTFSLDRDGEPRVVEMTKSGYTSWVRPLQLNTEGVTEISATLTRSEENQSATTSPATGSTGRRTSRHRRGVRAGGSSTTQDVAPVEDVPLPTSTGAGSDEGPATLRINSQPWAQVFIDGQLIGNTPQMAIPVEPGIHKVMLVNEEFSLRKTLVIRVSAGQTITKVVNLKEP